MNLRFAVTLISVFAVSFTLCEQLDAQLIRCLRAKRCTATTHTCCYNTCCYAGNACAVTNWGRLPSTDVGTSYATTTTQLPMIENAISPPTAPIVPTAITSRCPSSGGTPYNPATNCCCRYYVGNKLRYKLCSRSPGTSDSTCCNGCP